MDSKKFNIQVVKKLVQDCKSALAKLEHGGDYEVAPEADRIINQCVEQLQELL